MAIKLIVFKEDYRCVIADVEEVVGADLGEPDCQLTKPYEFKVLDEEPADYKDRLEPWAVMNMSSDKKCRIQSDNILTLINPEKFILDAYKELTT